MGSATKSLAMVTGASSGLGAEYCRQLAGRCDLIIAVARRGDALASLADELAGQVEVQQLVADLGTIEGQTRVVEALRQAGPLDYLVNNAGMGTTGLFDTQSPEVQSQMLMLHAQAAQMLCRTALPFMRERGSGAIINVSTVAALVAQAETVVYGASKAYLNYFTLALSRYLEGEDIRLQCLCPGFTRTGFFTSQTMTDFDSTQVPDALWMDAADVVSASLSALDAGGPLVLVPGEGNLAMARQGLEDMLAALSV